jgi:Protein-disulfide isomerase
MTISSRLVRSLAATAAVAAVLLFAACSATPPASSGSDAAKATSVATGTVGAAHLDDGYLSVGAGSITVDTYIDPMCPYCGEFEKANGRQLAQLVNAGTITLRVHPLNFLDQSSQGTAYSSRAANALICVAAASPKQTLSYLGTLYAHQPPEGSSGLTDKQLVSLASDVGAASITHCVQTQKYVPWVSKITNTALNGPIKGADITQIKGTPTVLVNGHSYQGGITDVAAVKAFVEAGGQG